MRSDVHSPHTDVSHCHALSHTHLDSHSHTHASLVHSPHVCTLRSSPTRARWYRDTPHSHSLYTHFHSGAHLCSCSVSSPTHPMSQRPAPLHRLLIATRSHSSLTHPSFTFIFFRFGLHVPAPILFIISQILLVSTSLVTKQRQGLLCGPHTTGPVHTGTCHGAPSTEGCEQLLISLFCGNNLELEPYRVTHPKSVRRKMTPVRFSFVFFNNMGLSCPKA